MQQNRDGIMRQLRNVDCADRCVSSTATQILPLQSMCCAVCCAVPLLGGIPCRGLLDGSFPTDRAVVYTFVLALPMAHIPSLPKLQVQMRLQEMRQLLLQARRMALSADHSQAAAAAGEPCGTDSAAGVIRPARSSTASSQEALCAATSMAAGLAAGKTANKAVSRGGAAGTTAKAAAEAVASRRTVTARRSARLADRQAVPALRLAS